MLLFIASGTYSTILGIKYQPQTLAPIVDWMYVKMCVPTSL